MNKLKQLLIGAALVSMPLTGLALNVHAAAPTSVLGGLDTVAGSGGAGLSNANNDPIAVVGNLISLFLGFLGIIFLILTIYAGIVWMTAMGDEKKITKAKGILISSIVGLVVILASYAISSFVISSISTNI